MYWAGSDRDGAVVGYYFAVVETPARAAGGRTERAPRCLAPKARDYQFTTRTDSIFIFHASEEVSERRTRFLSTRSDNKGRPDPTPARFVFSAYDASLRSPSSTSLKAVGTIYELGAGRQW